MPTPTYELIASSNGNGSSDTITLSSIPQTYTDLILIQKLKNVSGGITAPTLHYNGDYTSGNYSGTRLGASTTVDDERDTTYQYPMWSSDLEFSAGVSNIMNYTSTAIRKSSININGVATSGQDLIRIHTGVWRNTAAITSVSLLNTSSVAFTNNSKITLYGIKAS